MKNILIAIDSFKNSISSSQAASHLKKGLGDSFNVTSQIISDGGEGALDVILNTNDFNQENVKVLNAIGKETSASYALNYKSKTAFIEMAKSSGLELLKKGELNPLYTSTFGVGQMILHAYHKGFRNFVISIGGSATNDGGAGMLSALGVKLEGADSDFVSNASLKNIKSINTENLKIKDCNFTILSDVDNQLLGKNGTTYVYAKQKGAKEEDLPILESNLKYFSEIVEKHTSKNIKNEKGTGAAGGIAFGLKSFFDTKITSGISEIIKITGLEQKIIEADLVITGEGKIDKQSLNGKAISGITNICYKHSKPFILVAGILENEVSDYLREKGCIAEYALIDFALNTEDSINNASILLKQIGRKIAKDLS